MQRHTVDQIVETFVPFHILDDLVPQMVDQLVEVFKLLDIAVPEQVIDVPKISKSAEGGTVGGSADCRLHPFSSSILSSRPLTFQFMAVSSVVFQVLSQDRVQQLFLVQRKRCTFMAASQKTVAEKSIAKVSNHSEAVSVAAKAGKFITVSQKTGTDKSVANVPMLAESESVAEKAGTFKTASQKTEVSSREARVARPLDFHPGQGQQLFVELIPLFSLLILSRDRVQERLVVLIIMVMALSRG